MPKESFLKLACISTPETEPVSAQKGRPHEPVLKHGPNWTAQSVALMDRAFALLPNRAETTAQKRPETTAKGGYRSARGDVGCVDGSFVAVMIKPGTACK